MDTRNICKRNTRREKLTEPRRAGRFHQTWVKVSRTERENTEHSPGGGGAFLQRGGCAGSIGESTLGRHDQGEGHTGFTGALAVGVGH